MAYSPSSPLTGSAITGLTSPTFTLSVDYSPNNVKTHAVTALGGTQTGVSAHSPDLPFTISFKRPTVLKTLGAKNAVTGMYTSVPKNEYGIFLRKGVAVQSGQNDTFAVDVRIRVPAGAATYDAASLKSASSCLGGLIANQVQGIVDTMLTGVM
jgi:hypothetical protein